MTASSRLVPNSAADRRLALQVAVASDRLQLERALARLRGSVRQRLDLAARVRAQPLPWVLGALAFGLVLGLRRR